MELARPVQHTCCERCTDRARYVRQVADLMGLRDWVIEVAHEPAQAGAIADITMAAHRRLAMLRFADDFEGEIARHALVHELLHPYFQPVYETVESTSRDELGGQTHRVFLAQVEREIERSADALAYVMATYMPLPAW